MPCLETSPSTPQDLSCAGNSPNHPGGAVICSLHWSFFFLVIIINSFSHILSILGGKQNHLQASVKMSKSGQCTSIINLTYKDGAEGSPSNPAKFNNQDYVRLKEKCRLGGRLFIDSTFPPENRSLGDLPSLESWEEAQVQWLRPKVKLINNNVCALLFFTSSSQCDCF